MGVEKWVSTVTPTNEIFAQAEIRCIMTIEGRIKDYRFWMLYDQLTPIGRWLKH